MIIFRQQLRVLRKMRNLSQRQISEKLKVKQTTYSTWECGNGTPNPDMIIRIADFYHISVHRLITGKEFCRIKERAQA